MLLKDTNHMPENFSASANKAALNAFINSLLVEGIPVSFEFQNDSKRVLKYHELEVSVDEVSICGHHSFNYPILHKNKEISFEDFTKIATSYYRQDNSHAQNAKPDFFVRIKDSLENINNLLEERRNDIDAFFDKNKKFTFIDAEQFLVFGHPTHPYPKCREGFDQSALRHFTPELKGHFALIWLSVEKEIASVHFADEVTSSDYQDYSTKQVNSTQIDNERILMPMHPWQWNQLKNKDVIKNYLDTKKIIVLERTLDSQWYPTSSLRSVYNVDAPFMFKFSMSVRLTNSIRHLQVEEVVRGAQVVNVLNTKAGQNFKKEFADFTLITEPGFLALKDTNQEILPETIVVLRSNPFQDEREEHEIACLATLTQENPLGGKNIILNRLGTTPEQIKLWFDRFLKIAVEPLLIAQAKYGIYFGAHQQNLVLKLDHSFLPVHAYFRDCQGTGYEKNAYLEFVKESPTLNQRNGNDLDSDLGNMLISYYIIVNSVFGVIHALTSKSGTSEEYLCARFVTFLKTLKQRRDLRDSSCLNYLLQSDFLYQKGNFECCALEINENTTENPFSIYKKIPNPFCSETVKYFEGLQ